MSPPLLVLSNGHGEDVIALQLIAALQRRRPDQQVQVLPLVGEGRVFGDAERAGLLRLVGPRQPLPSGGFSSQSLQGMAADLAAGLALLSWRQWRWVRRWGASGRPVLAVGDLLPLLLAWGSGAPFAFLGTPKSDFTWMSAAPTGWGGTPLADGYHRCKGSEWDPWEWALMRSRRCRLVALRDTLTARGLRRRAVPAVAVGNPMGDALQVTAPPAWLRHQRRLVLLPGSRLPEALGNAHRLLEALLRWLPRQPTTVLLACGSRPDREDWDKLLGGQGWRSEPPGAAAAACGAAAAWRQGLVTLVLGPGRFETWAAWAEVGLATAGTATEQLVGLGIPALSLPGPGPQFKAGFARRQSRLLGGAVLPCRDPAELAARLTRLLEEPELRRRLGAIGRRRMGPAGGSDRLAGLLEERLLVQPSSTARRLG
ncbi:lipid-A-disaccharide synthase-related protein [Cyanobium sp. CH-040]|uniref:lipid-A-disaccharide synthase-related protein n=1 Tax=Cyanobium sp. CH-040 TaxID=2823708 RepID=UPI0020CE4CE6|nr:lipid-A-disaccharide synthase-related protein [Cyanobium sp. CH-040]MCP9929032.1 lipid-A-disaccharide synthase-related protein [Cyanobium sp. CH-040]